MRSFSTLVTMSSTLVALAGCSPPAPQVYIDFLSETPLEVDTYFNGIHEGDPGCDGELEVYWAEEVCVQVSVELDDWYIETRQVALDFTDYCVAYELLNENGTLDRYCNGLQLHVDAGETGSVPVRAVSFDQKDFMGDTFGGSAVNVRATMTLFATNQWNNEQFEFTSNYDIIMGDFNGCDEDAIISCQ
jgi:hypothetical protein